MSALHESADDALKRIGAELQEALDQAKWATEECERVRKERTAALEECEQLKTRVAELTPLAFELGEVTVEWDREREKSVGLAQRVAELEPSLKAATDQVDCLKADLAEALRRIQTLKGVIHSMVEGL